MGEFYLDTRPLGERRTELAAERLKHFPDMRVVVLERPEFSLVVSRCDEADVWGGYVHPTAGIRVALAGRVALEPSEWERAKGLPGEGGLAAKAICDAYQRLGSGWLSWLNGNFTVIVHDPRDGTLRVVTDRCGAAPAFRTTGDKTGAVFSSHPDVLAAATGQSDALDTTSLSEFLSTGRPSYPYTYYRGIRSLAPGTVYEARLTAGEPAHFQTATYFSIAREGGERGASEDEVAEGLAGAFRGAMRRRTAPATGVPVVSLSGGLDSRMILSACPEPERVRAICFYDDLNAETAAARRIADACGVRVELLHRRFEHYGDSASDGVRVSGAMSSLASNHYLGFRKDIIGIGAGSLLTGCYCDYLFKGLALNTRTHKFHRFERLAPFGHGWYRPFFRLEASPMAAVEARLEETYPSPLRQSGDPGVLLKLEEKRMFPLAYEPDSTMRVIPQRVLPWAVPIVDNDVIDVYRRTTVAMKLNARMFTRMVQRVCGPDVCRIPDSNTGAPVGASKARIVWEVYRRALGNKLKDTFRPSLATSGSWPNWNYYVAHSDTIRRLWTDNQNASRDLLTSLAGADPFAQPMSHWLDGRLELFIRLLTLKIWSDVRIRG